VGEKLKKVKQTLKDLVFGDPNLKSNEEITEHLGIENS